MKIKLIIWDLDDTFWSGTLSEGEVEPSSYNIEILELLTNHGVINSISYKNDYFEAKEKLEDLKVWDYFVFPSIEWKPKGPLVKNLISNMQLRPENCLFIDDNISNLKEVQFYCPDINTMNSKDENLKQVLNSLIVESKLDIENTRLKQYKILEAKQSSISSFDTNEEFLIQSKIRIEFIKSPIHIIDRIHDLVNRTNQLNFTKKRDNKEQLKNLIINNESYAVKVKDKYGDYGVVGFVCFEGNEIRHFLFSCRALNMGIESATYFWLGKPKLEINGEVANGISNQNPYWIKIKSSKMISVNFKKKFVKNILLIGGCDLSSLMPYFQNKYKITTHFNYQSSMFPKLQIHRDSIEYLTIDYTSTVINELLRTCFFLDEDVFMKPDFSEFDVIVYSPLIDYIQARFKSKNISNLQIAISDFRNPLGTKIGNEDYLINKDIPKKELDLFLDNWEEIEFNYTDFENKLHTFINQIPPSKKIIMLNGVEKNFNDFEHSLLDHHKMLNSILFKIEEKYPNIEIIDVNQIVNSRDSMTNSIRHYTRKIYFELSKVIIKKSKIKKNLFF